jgi:DNA-binding NtrC family response regulator
MKKSLLVIEHDESVRKLFDKSIGRSGFEIFITDDFMQGIKLLKEMGSFDGILVDSDLLRPDPLKSIADVKNLDEDALLVLMGSFSAEEVVEVVKHGADGVIDAPAQSIDATLSYLENLWQKQGKLNPQPAKESTGRSADMPQMVGQSRVILELKRLIQKVAPLDSTILINGETGTGKEIVAHMIHAMSPHRHNNFLAVHCGGIPDTLLESTLFGHEKGSFTGAYRTHKGHFEIADKGTIFLDEIGDTTPSFQVKLLRVLQDKQFRRIGGTDVLTTSARIIAATNRDLTKMVQQGQFREDLYFRLNVITLRVPPLRERPDDIALLIRYFVHLFSKKHNHLGVYLKPETIEILKRQPWRGNVRELENVIERLVALSDSDWIGSNELPEDYLRTPETGVMENLPHFSYADAKNFFEKEYIIKLLIQANGNISRAAKMAKMPRQNLHLKIKKHKIRSETLRTIKAQMSDAGAMPAHAN